MAASSRALLVATAVLVLAAFGFLGSQRDALERVVGDEGTFLAMTQSLALDGDFLFGAADLARAEATDEPGRRALILQRAEGRLSYSKSWVYPLLAAPFYRLAGEGGVVFFNFLALALAGALAWGFLCRLGSRPSASWTLLVFVGASTLLPLAVYRMSDLLQVALSLSGGVLALAALRSVPEGESDSRLQRLLASRWAPWIGGVLLGLLGVARYPNFVFPAGVTLALVVAARWRHALAVAVATAATAGVLLAAGELATGAAVPYKAERATFNEVTGYPTAAADEVANRGFVERRATQRLGAQPLVRPSVSAYASLYFFLGRHTGLLVYFPAVVALMIAALGWRARPDRVTFALYATLAAAFVFFVVWMPENYFGGATFVGNRYAASLYPLFLLALPRLPGRRALAASGLLAVAVWASAAASELAVGERARHSQTHTFGGLFRLLPYESTGRNIDGRQDRYWSGDFVRFQDPFAKVGESSWKLAVGDRPSEVMLATQHPQNSFDLLVHAPGGDVELVYGDWAGEGRYPVAAPGGLVRVETSEPWRRHSYWFPQWEIYDTRVVRLAAEGDQEGEVELRYLGTTLDGMATTLLHEVEIPAAVTAGSTVPLHIRVRNMSDYPWYQRGVVPLRWVIDLRPVDGTDRDIGVPARGVFDLPHDVGSGDPVLLEAPVLWPTVPGDYRVIVDLQYGDLMRFEQRAGAPMVERKVVVGAP